MKKLIKPPKPKKQKKKKSRKEPEIPKYKDEFVNREDICPEDQAILDNLMGNSEHNESLFKDIITIENKLTKKKTTLEKIWKESHPHTFVFDKKPYALSKDADIADIITKGIFHKLDEIKLEYNDAKITIQQDVVVRYRRDM